MAMWMTWQVDVAVTRDEVDHLAVLCKSEVAAASRIAAGGLRFVRSQGSSLITQHTIDQMLEIGEGSPLVSPGGWVGLCCFHLVGRSAGLCWFGADTCGARVSDRDACGGGRESGEHRAASAESGGRVGWGWGWGWGWGGGIEKETGRNGAAAEVCS